MSDELNAFERLDADMPLPLDLRALEDRVIDDSLAWEARVPSAERLMRFARELPGSGAPQTDEPAAGGGPGPRPGGAPERIRHRAAPGYTPRRHALAAYAAAFGLMTLTTLLLVQLASFRMVGTSVPPRRAEATATALTTPTGEPTALPAASPIATQTTGAGDTGGSQVTGLATRLQVKSLSITLDRTSYTGLCQSDMYYTISLDISVYPFDPYRLENQAYVAYSVLMDGEVNSFYDNAVVDINPITGDSKLTIRFDYGATYGDGTPHTLAVEATAPNVVVSPPVTISLLCQRQIIAVNAAPTPETWTGTCTGSQTFSFSYEIDLSPGPDIPISWSEARSPEFSPPNGVQLPTTGVVWARSHILATQVFFTGNPYALTANQPNGQYWEQVTFVGPMNTVTSDKLLVTKSCA